MSMFLTPLSRYRSYGGGLGQRENVVRTVETVGRFRRSYSFNPTAGVSSTKTAFEEYRFVTDWRTPFEAQLKILSSEIDNHEPCIKSICDKEQEKNRVTRLELESEIEQLTEAWDDLKEAVEKRRERLASANDAREYLNDVYGSESEYGAERAVAKRYEEKHQEHMHKISMTIKEMAEKAEILIRERNMLRGQVPLAVQPTQTESSSEESTTLEVWKPDIKPDNAYVPTNLTNGTLSKSTAELYGLHGEIDELLQWIGNREAIAEAQELGQNYEHVQALQNRFQHFASETESIGSKRVAKANKECDKIIASEHEDAPIVALWKDNLNEAWENLLELMYTWTLLLEANMKLQKFFYDCRETYGRIQDKMHSIPEELGRYTDTLADMQRKHQTLVNELKTLDGRVKQIQIDGDDLLESYAGDKSLEIQMRGTEVLKAQRQLQMMFDHKRFDLSSSRDLFKFMQMSKELSQWMEAVKKKIAASDKPKDVANIEPLSENLEALKSEIDAHEENFVTCVALGRDLLSQHHYGSWEVEKKLIRLTTERADLMRYWGNTWDHLQLVLNVFESASEATPNTFSSGEQRYQSQNGIETVIKAINKCQVAENLSSAHDELLRSLDKLTIFDLKELHRRQVDESKKRQIFVSIKETTSQKIETTFHGKHGASPVETTLSSGPISGTNGNYPLPLTWPIHRHFDPSDKTGVKTGEGFEGTLIRKRTWDSIDQKASNRGWEKLYCVFSGSRLFLYRDFKHKESMQPLRGEGPIYLPNCVAEVASEYSKRRHVFSLRMSDGAEFLFQARDDDDMYRWLQHLQLATGQPQESVANRSTTPTSSQSASSKKKNFFLTKKK